MKRPLITFFFFLFFYFNSSYGQDQYNDLLFANIKKCDLPAVKNLKHYNINATDSNKANALMYAVYYCDLPMVKYLVQQGAKLPDGGIIFIDAEKSGYYGNITGIAAGLGKIEILEYLSGTLHLSLEEKEYNPHTQQKDGWTPLLWAIYNRQVDALKFLINKKVNLHEKVTSSKITPLIFSVQIDNMVIFKLLLSSAGNIFGNRAGNYISKAGEIDSLQDMDREAAKTELELALVKEYFGSNDIAYTNTSIKLGRAYYLMGQYEKALSIFLEAKPIFEKVLGKEDPQYHMICVYIGGTYAKFGQYNYALPMYLEALQLREKTAGKYNTDYATAGYLVATAYSELGEYKRSELFGVEAKQIREKILGKDHVEYVESCNNLGLLYGRMAQYQKAESLYLEARRIIEKIFGKEHTEFATNSSNLAQLYNSMGLKEKAELLYLESKQIREQKLGKNHPDYALSCNNLGAFYTELEKYDKAETLYLEAIGIQERTLGKQHPMYATSCANLGVLYAAMGQYANAESLFLQSKEIREKVLGENHPDYASVCSYLAGLYWDQGEYEKAEPLSLEAKNVRERSFGKDHPLYAVSCNNHAALYHNTGEYEKAEALHLEAKQIREKIFGKNHSDYAISCQNLAALYKDMGQYEKAEAFGLEAKQITANTLGKQHPNYAAVCITLARINRGLNKFQNAADLYRETFTIKYAMVKNLFQFTGETEKQQYINNIIGDAGEYLSFYYASKYQHAGDAYNLSFLNRSLIAASGAHLKNVAYNSVDPTVAKVFDDWMNSKSQLAFWYSKPADKRPGNLKELETKANDLEKRLARISSEFKDQQGKDHLTWKNIQETLQPNEASIEFAEFKYYDGRSYIDSTFYIALLLRKDKTEPQLVRLFEKKQLDNLLANTGNKNKNENIKMLYIRGAGEDEPGMVTKSVYDLIWKPLENNLAGISKIYFAPAGMLHRISFSALPVNDSEVLSDKYQLVQLNNTASVIGQSSYTITASDKIVLFGGIIYDADSTALKKAVVKYAIASNTSRSLPQDVTRGNAWQELSGTQVEVDGIKKASLSKYAVSVFSGIDATEESVKVLNGKASPAVLHIATHGFFFSDPANDNKHTANRDFELAGKVFKQSGDPLLRSGLLFAGANNAWQNKPVKGIEDGILTSYEVSNLYLPNTKLVVLSACETALGDIHGSEGVYGLQRAFKMAGIGNLVMSLWKVPDAETAEFMQEFYKNMFNKESISDAFYHAQYAMKNKYRSDPFKWAAWVLVR